MSTLGLAAFSTHAYKLEGGNPWFWLLTLFLGLAYGLFAYQSGRLTADLPLTRRRFNDKQYLRRLFACFTPSSLLSLEAATLLLSLTGIWAASSNKLFLMAGDSADFVGWLWIGFSLAGFVLGSLSFLFPKTRPVSQGLFQKDYWERKALAERRPPGHPVVRHYALSKIMEIRKTVKIQPGQRLLDLGCGNGFFSQPFSEICQTVGVDFSQAMLQANPLDSKFGMDANRLAFQDMAFDVVFCHALLHHVEEPGKVLSEMRRVSRKYVVVMEPNRANPLMCLFSALVAEERCRFEIFVELFEGLAGKERPESDGGFFPRHDRPEQDARFSPAPFDAPGFPPALGHDQYPHREALRKSNFVKTGKSGSVFVFLVSLYLGGKVSGFCAESSTRSNRFRQG